MYLIIALVVSITWKPIQFLRLGSGIMLLLLDLYYYVYVNKPYNVKFLLLCNAISAIKRLIK